MDDNLPPANGEDVDLEGALDLAPIGSQHLSALLNAIQGKPDHLVERDYLETKSMLNFSQKSAFSTVAKFILAAANRMPDEVAPQLEGYAVLIVGASSLGITGIPPMDHHQVKEGVDEYLPDPSPPWDFDWVVTADGENVLFVMVPPPKWGQDPFVADRDGEKFENGTVYVRVSSATRKARAPELLRLIRRGASVATPVDLSIEPIGKVCPARCGTAILEALIETRGTMLEERRAREQAGFNLGAMSVGDALRFGLSGARKTPSPAQFEEWSQIMRGTWSEREMKWVGCAWPGMAFRIVNRSKMFFTNVQIEMVVDGVLRPVEKVDPESYGDELVENLPGFRAEKPLYTPFFPHFYLDSPLLPKAGAKKTDTGVSIWIRIPELRPLETYTSDDDAYVLVSTSVEQTPALRATWQLTAQGHHDRYEGTCEIEVAQELDLSPLVRAFSSREMSGMQISDKG
jgi:hypothetical protein